MEVQKTVNVDLPAPRDHVETKELPEFGHLRAHVYRAIERREGATVGAAANAGAAAPVAPETRGQ